MSTLCDITRGSFQNCLLQIVARKCSKGRTYKHWSSGIYITRDLLKLNSCGDQKNARFRFISFVLLFHCPSCVCSTFLVNRNKNPAFVTFGVPCGMRENNFGGFVVTENEIVDSPWFSSSKLQSPPPNTHAHTRSLAVTALCQSAPSGSLCSRLAALLLLCQPELMEPGAEPKQPRSRRRCIGTRSSHKVKRQMQRESWISRDSLVLLGFVSVMERPQSFRWEGREQCMCSLTSPTPPPPPPGPSRIIALSISEFAWFLVADAPKAPFTPIRVSLKNAQIPLQLSLAFARFHGNSAQTERCHLWRWCF